MNITKEYRRQNYLTQEEFGKLLGVFSAGNFKVGKGGIISKIAFLPYIALLLHCSVNDFFST